MTKIGRIVLAYSGGLDTSIILKWLQERYGCEVVAFTADLGQGEELEPARRKAERLGAAAVRVEDLREEFARDFVFPMFRANAVYEGEYLLGTSIARPLIAKRLVEIAGETGADAIAHGATGKGNDQVRFELGRPTPSAPASASSPRGASGTWVRAKACWPMPRRTGSPSSGRRATSRPIRWTRTSCTSPSRGTSWRTPGRSRADSMWRMTRSPEDAPDRPAQVTLTFERGDVAAVDGEAMTPGGVMATLNRLGGAHGVGRIDVVENRYVGMKVRGCYETPGGTILLRAHRAIESLTLDREVAHLKDELMPRYASLVYNGYWWSPERLALQTFIDETQRTVNGEVRLKLYKGNVLVTGRRSDTDGLYRPDLATFEDDRGAYDQRDAEGFIRLNALRMRVAAAARRRGPPPPAPETAPRNPD